MESLKLCQLDGTKLDDVVNIKIDKSWGSRAGRPSTIEEPMEEHS
jgi:hypothetical protein